MSKTDKEINEIINSLEGEELCVYCVHNSYCSHGVTGTPNGPSYPPCADGLTIEDFDLESYLEDREGEQ